MTDGWPGAGLDGPSYAFTLFFFFFHSRFYVASIHVRIDLTGEKFVTFVLLAFPTNARLRPLFPYPLRGIEKIESEGNGCGIHPDGHPKREYGCEIVDPPSLPPR